MHVRTSLYDSILMDIYVYAYFILYEWIIVGIFFYKLLVYMSQFILCSSNLSLSIYVNCLHFFFDDVCFT